MRSSNVKKGIGKHFRYLVEPTLDDGIIFTSYQFTNYNYDPAGSTPNRAANRTFRKSAVFNVVGKGVGVFAITMPNIRI